MTADSRTNSFHGLPGSLLRIGARAIIGSRWPVHDEAAAVLMATLHHRLRSSSESPDLCLHRARTQMREGGYATEDWAAFAYFGVV
jgi:CHAT domain-containing protein